MLSNSEAYNSDFMMHLNFNIKSLSVGQSVGLLITKNGKLCLYVDGMFNVIVWKGLPTDKQYWGVADVYGPVSSIKSSFIICKSVYNTEFVISNHFCQNIWGLIMKRHNC